MPNTELEIYLAKLAKGLGPISVSEKAEIITEIKSHVMDAMDSTDRPLSEILSGLGEPEQVANRYLLERGLTPQRAPKHPMVKWLVIGLLGTTSLVLLSGVILLWKFTPLIKVDEEKGQVKILGGLIDIDESAGVVKVAGMVKSDWELEESFSGRKEISSDIKMISMDFSNADLEVKNGVSGEIQYDCKLNGKVKDFLKDSSLAFNFKETSGAKCIFSVPKDVNLEVNAQNGKFKFDELGNNLVFSGVNGKVKFRPDTVLNYKYQLALVNGKMDHFESSDDLNAYNVKISLMNGKIKN